MLYFNLVTGYGIRQTWEIFALCQPTMLTAAFQDSDYSILNSFPSIKDPLRIGSSNECVRWTDSETRADQRWAHAWTVHLSHLDTGEKMGVIVFFLCSLGTYYPTYWFVPLRNCRGCLLGGLQLFRPRVIFPYWITKKVNKKVGKVQGGK